MTPSPDPRIALEDGPTDCIPAQSAEVATELRESDYLLLHCLECGRQVVAKRHGNGCMLCGSRAVLIESP